MAGLSLLLAWAWCVQVSKFINLWKLSRSGKQKILFNESSIQIAQKLLGIKMGLVGKALTFNLRYLDLNFPLGSLSWAELIFDVHQS